MSEILAKCTHCGTSFSVTTDQLQIAKGKVRCGVCMKVFQAADPASLPSQNAEPAPTPPPPPPKKPSPPPSQEEVKASEAKARAPGDNIRQWLEENKDAQPGSNIQSGPVDAPKEDELTDALNFEDDISDDFMDVDTAPAPGEPGFELKIEDDDEDIEGVSSFNAQLDDGDDFDDQISNAVSEGRGSVEMHQIASEPQDDFSSADSFDEDPFAISDSQESFTQVELSSDEFLEEDTGKFKLPPKVVWGSLASLFTILFFVQVLVSEFDTLSRNTETRPIYEAFCGIGLCDLPALVAVDKIRGSNLIVRPHPTQGGALSVDAIVNNQAAFAQKFPAIELSFSDTQGTVVASRSFKPNEYLSGDLKGMELMPAQTPVHLSLEILDPGKNAVSYQLDFSPQ